MASDRRILALVITGKSGTYRFSSAAYCTTPSDSPSNTIFHARISNDPTFTKKANLRIWGSNRAVSSVGYFDIINDDAAFDSLFTDGAFGSAYSAEVSILFNTAAWASRTVVATLVVDRIEPVSEGVLRISLKDKSVALDKALVPAYDSTPTIDARKNYPKMVVIGSPKQVEMLKVNTSLNLLDVHSDRRFWHDGVQVSSRGVPATKGTDWRWSINSTCSGVEYLVSMANGDPFTIDHVNGACYITSTLIDSNFTTWTGSPAAPSDGWAYDGTYLFGSRRFSDNGGTCQMRCTFAPVSLAMRKTGVTIPSNSKLLFEFDITSVTTAGTVIFEVRDSTNTTTIDSKSIVLNGTGKCADTLSVGSNSGTIFRIHIGGTTIDVSIDNFKLHVIETTDAPAKAAYYLAVVLGGVAASDFDSTSWNSLDIGGAPYSDTVGIVSEGDTMISDCLDEIAASYTAWWWFDRVGDLRVSQLIDPTSLGPGDVDFHLPARQIAQNSDLSVTVDMCPGLSTIWAYNKNSRVLGDNDMAGSVTAANRSIFGAEFRLRGQYTGSALPSLYSHVNHAPPVETCLQNMNGTKSSDEPNRVCGFYTVVRSFKSAKWIMAGSDSVTVELGDVVSSDLNRYGISADYHLVVGIEGSFLSNTVALTLWS